MAAQIEKKDKILIFSPFGIGDVLCSTPLIRNIKDNLPESLLSYMCNRKVYPLLRNNKLLDKIIIFDKDEWREVSKKSKIELIKKFFEFKNEIKNENYDIVFDLSMRSFYGFFFKLAAIPVRIGFNFKRRGRVLTHKLDIPEGFQRRHIARYYLDLLNFLNITAKDYNFDLALSGGSLDEEERILRNYNLNKGDLLIGVSPTGGSTWGKNAYFRRWPKESFSKLCDKLIQELGVKIILFASQEASDVCNEISKSMKEAPVNLCGKLNLENLCSMVSVCKAFITNDGGSFHIAQALGKKGIVFIGPLDEKTYGVYPETDNWVAFTSNVPCRPCYKRFKFAKCEFDKRCLRAIGVDEVFSKIKELITSE